MDCDFTSSKHCLCLFDIYNDILRAGLVPKSWYRTKVVPILKPGENPALSDSYRPISLLACGQKLIEKMICTRLDFWAEKNGILFSTQYGFRKGRGNRDCLALLTTDISTSLEMKEQTVAAFLDVSGAYDNVLIDVLCRVMLDKELPVGLVRFLRNLLWCKALVFYVGGVECMTLSGYKGLPQGSVLNPLLYNLLGFGMDSFIPSGCNFFQYADDIGVYSSHHIFEIAGTELLEVNSWVCWEHILAVCF
jgi:hypothetical protein